MYGYIESAIKPFLQFSGVKINLKLKLKVKVFDDNKTYTARYGKQYCNYIIKVFGDSPKFVIVTLEFNSILS